MNLLCSCCSFTGLSPLSMYKSEGLCPLLLFLRPELHKYLTTLEEICIATHERQLIHTTFSCISLEKESSITYRIRTNYASYTSIRQKIKKT